MDTRRALLIDAFTSEPLSGTVTGVIPDADGLNERQMRAVAGELAASQTAFLLTSGEADRRVRYVGPTGEVDRCPPATVACHSVLLEDGRIDAGTHALETIDGVIDVEVEETGRVWAPQAGAEIRESDCGRERVADALGIDPAALADIGQDLPLARASTGLPVLLVPVNFLEHLGQAVPDPTALRSLCEEADVRGVYAFTFDTLEMESTVHGRMFAPATGPEGPPATGTAAGACAAYLRRYGAFDTLPDEMIVEQGDFAERPDRVHVRAGGEVQVGGHAVTALDGRLVVPDRESEDIVEA